MLLSMKTLLMVVLASIKRVGDLQAFSVDKLCLEFGFTLFRDQKVNLQALSLEEACLVLAFCDCKWTELKASGPQTSSLSVMEASRRERLSPSRG